VVSVLPPRLVIAAPASGHGKTTVATGLMAALRRRGVAVSGHKVGPDYIDPGYHALATGRPPRNLDPVLVGADLIAPLFAHGAAGAEVAVVEGVMGLWDGRAGAGSTGSTAHVAALLRAPVLLVVDAAAQSRSVAALLHGFATWAPGDVPPPRIAGVVLNRVGSDRHEAMLREACEQVGVPVVGVLRRHDAVATPSRHLGLVPAAEHATTAIATVEALADVVAACVDLDAVVALATSAPPVTAEPWSPRAAVGEPVDGRPVVALAGGAAFTFGYAEHAELLRAAGADVVVVDPIRDPRLPAGTAALVVGGGFPEVHAEQLSVNTSLREDVGALAASGAPIAAECAGLLWLCRTLDGRPMCGVLEADAAMTDTLTLGYRDAVAIADSVLASTGERVTGHEFHHTVVRPRRGTTPAWGWRDGGAEGFVDRGVHASYLHTHWAARPAAVRRFVAAAARVGAAA